MARPAPGRSGSRAAQRPTAARRAVDPPRDYDSPERSGGDAITDDSENDVRAPRTNRDAVRAALRHVRSDWRRFENEKDPVRRRGYAALLRASLDRYLQTPDALPPLLADGAVEPAEWIERDGFAPGNPVFTDERPFDTPGPVTDRCFFYAYARFSWLYEGPSRDPYYVGGPLARFVYFVHSFEKHYATPTPTTMHTSDPSFIRRRARALGLGDAGSIAVFGDARGLPRADTHVVGWCDALDVAIAAADTLAAESGIRMLVATLRHVCDNH